MALAFIAPVTHILVPQGAEYIAVKQGLAGSPVPEVIAIPMGMAAVGAAFTQGNRLQRLTQPNSQILLLGLGGGLDPSLKVGDRILYQQCSDISGQSCQTCDPTLTNWLQAQFPFAKSVRGLTSDRIICQAQEKAKLYAKTGLEVIDMEGLAILSHLNKAGIATAILRVISDDASQSLPDLSLAIAPDGQLRPLVLAQQFAKHPLAAARLIRGSLVGLGELTAITRHLTQLSRRDAEGIKVG